MKFLCTNFRSLLQKFRAASMLNIAGLAVALAVAIVVAIQVRWDFTYDRGYANAEKIFTAERYQHSDGARFRTLTMQLSQTMLDQIPEVETFTLTQGGEEFGFGRQEADGSTAQHSIPRTRARGDFLGVFTPRIVVATPVAWFVVRRWLEGFAYRAEVPWWLFAVSGVAVAAVSIATVSSRSYKAATANPVESLKSE